MSITTKPFWNLLAKKKGYAARHFAKKRRNYMLFAFKRKETIVKRKWGFKRIVFGKRMTHPRYFWRYDNGCLNFCK